MRGDPLTFSRRHGFPVVAGFAFDLEEVVQAALALAQYTGGRGWRRGIGTPARLEQGCLGTEVLFKGQVIMLVPIIP